MTSGHLDNNAMLTFHSIANDQLERIMPSLSHTSETDLAIGILYFFAIVHHLRTGHAAKSMPSLIIPVQLTERQNFHDAA